MKIYLIRHGQTEWNTLGKWQGHSDICLNETGVAQAAAIARRLADKKGQIARIYSSPLLRAYKTAEEINRGLGVEIVTRDDLKEIFLGKWEGKTVQEIVGLDADHFRRWEEEDNPLFGFDIETYFALRERAWRALNEFVAEEGDEKDAVIVSHGA
ncbi:MAG: histidine phosphatase family protein, partial [Clostridiales bacterium]|nr:histidine phosphatase family protein [Clostridiales bacterium]